MTVGVVLLIYAVLVGVLGAFACRHDAALTRAPRLGAVLLLTCAWSVLTALFLAGLTVALPGTMLSNGLSQLLGACILRLRAAYVTPGGAAVAGAGLTLSGTILLRAGWALLRCVRTRRATHSRQRTLIALCGKQESISGAVVLDQPTPAVYCLAGRRDSTVVLTEGARRLLSGPQLAAVLAHEHAHLRARHHRLLGAAAVAGSILPETRFFSRLPQQVRRLLEMHADDLAASSHDPETLATALVAVATAHHQPTKARAHSPVLAAADTDAVARIHRLLDPPGSLPARGRRTVRIGIAALGLIPLLTAFTPAAVAAHEPPVRKAGVADVSPHPSRIDALAGGRR